MSRIAIVVTAALAVTIFLHQYSTSGDPPSNFMENLTTTGYHKTTHTDRFSTLPAAGVVNIKWLLSTGAKRI
ncbi:MAG TPA: hypothetical protein VKO43_01400 [Candidatus Krumholzibacteriaceae bacterium]|nr:hypothetical protein [Candidatus Krumholzibacteriaceae bacterium]